ncbi:MULTISPECIES: 7-carboxy-7-deazaguanine synthase QueE [unclassified Synechocystis]|uniref:7-carboxy-7-deazaguanine synthase QueE n=1 Tax=unclassified Synechocystis TaxID=2640012 RepID=UPI00041C1E3C|nr:MULTISPECIES: 7-carboxy-7-deazaguanine synthase QueE [unclassified Synechocystis]AIE72694.1 Queuosine Biosynthesis QueE Radical SAM [Synechocystis sp. PCC 6714]MCT0254650.1 7-carboxy-7-deazaguanine synthase QueE [Synechocystis sp. CS-94]
MATISEPLTFTYPIAETFHSLQGEGAWAGSNAFFIRLGGCDVHCPWCDQKETWPTQHHPRQTVIELVQRAVQAKPGFVVITGGEPLMHDLNPLCQALKNQGLRLHLETSGVYPLTGQFDWITLSPKPYRLPQAEIYPLANELKVIISQDKDFSWAEIEATKVSRGTRLYLQAEWETEAMNARIFAYVLTHPQWRLGLQTHKYLGVR